MAKESIDKKNEKETGNNASENTQFDNIGLFSLLLNLTNLFNNGNMFEETSRYEYLKELYHSLDKRISLLEQKTQKKFF